ncbi:DUF4263 domain-containing protein [Mesorhizobium sp. CGMCC 1.15528]|uniref:DUF4263 domain-containing protein n=1 Tax=Mesorhizobium zhangyense TaxID=1776730 RepID=A0A7C9VGU5_9HYPH|nr:Shedu immune nuclease family protein [Mesorhizobium zhangyense]NGN45129.1 DUF4263 domain-containing protein [Mesorhizobium zhangyense]
MATFGPQFSDDDQGRLELSLATPGLVDVYFTPSEARLRAAGRVGDASARVLLLRFDAKAETTTIFPVNTMPTSARFLQPKHDPIISIALVQEHSLATIIDDFDDSEHFVMPKTLEDVQMYLNECMPSGFTKDPNFGLGLDRTLSFIIQALAKIDGVEHLRLTDAKTFDVSRVDDGQTFEMGFQLFDELRRGADRFDDKARASSRKKKTQLAYSNLLHKIDKDTFPLKLFEREPDDIAETIGRTIVDAKLSEKDRAAVIGLAKATVRSTLNTQRESVIKLHNEIELASLDELIAHIEAKLAVKTTELQWQALFEANPFILDMAFNVPVLLLQGQAHVGGKKLSGGGEKITDFLFANQLTDNLAILEIKTPATTLLSAREYRGGVYGPSPELVSAVTQLLDQVNHLQSDIFRLKAFNPDHRMESFGVRGVLVAGLIPEAERKRSFELYRNALGGISIITFDELLAKLKSLRTLLARRENR